MTEDETSEHVLCLEITEALLVYFNIVNNDYQHILRALYKIDPNELFRQLNYYIFEQKKSFFFKDLEFRLQVIEIWFTNQILNS